MVTILTLLFEFALLFAVVFGLVWAGTKLSGSHKPVNMRKVLVVSLVVSVVLLVLLTIVFAAGFSNLPDQK